jgi:hypothetical protein
MGRKKDLAKAQMREVVEEMQEEGKLPSPVEDEESPIIAPADVPSSIAPLLSSFPSAEGYFGKIYKVNVSNGDWQVMDYRIEAPETIPDGDLEGEVKRIVRQKKWGAGEYRVQIRRRGERSIFVHQRIIIDEEPIYESDGKGQAKNPVREQIGAMSDVINIVERLKPTPINAESIGNIILKAVDTGKNMATPTDRGNGADSQLLPIFSQLIPLLLKPPIDENSLVEKVVARLQTNPQSNDLERLVKLKDGLGLQFAHQVKKDDSIESVKKVTDIVSALRPLTGGASGEPTSTLGLILEHLPRLFEPLLTTFKEFAEAKKMEMQIRMNQTLGGVGHVPTAQQIEERKVIPAQRPMHPFAIRIIKAINENDESYFDMCRQQITRLYGQHVIDGLVDGTLTSDLVIETLHAELGVPLELENIKPYINKFIEFLKGNFETELLAECETCHEQYNFPNMKAWEEDSKKCEECSGPLKLFEKEGKA